MPDARDMVLDIQHLSVEFPVYGGAVRALDGVTLTIARGETVGVVGESGCGKSVTSLLAMGLLPRQAYRVRSGDISLLGVDVLTAPERELAALRGNRAAMIFQEPLTALNPTRRIGSQMIEVIRRHRRIGKIEARAQAIHLLGEMRVADAGEVLRRYPFELSGGMRQRVLIALAFSGDPAIVIADEPTTALDVTVQRQVLTLLRARARRSGTAVLLITHDMGIVSQYTDRVYVMYAGRVVESGDTRGVLCAPAHPYTRALLGALPERATAKASLNAIPGSVPDLRHPPAGCAYAPRCASAGPLCVDRPPMFPQSGAAERHAACWLLAEERVLA
ncbi:peptide ABC transporter substrate-binding protein [Acidihalobacter yilgarnensis]|uniref:Peptide ABC transporter substrate-binding protein n=1 Tax=Acidihalobacter yilgarnensis TaxID=2819280 RepID=A0A1D8IJX8_9GAMM|nr:ABC transporter ATP-binding protein [Acidihalobacter yilgarnensis]AOU96755.1 peptide ABC transporter substrate-binding protein [Acidihalobacter yilgarnensis]